jgi:hypothetical protein
MIDRLKQAKKFIDRSVNLISRLCMSYRKVKIKFASTKNSYFVYGQCFKELDVLSEWPDIPPGGCMFKNGSRNL